MRHFGNPLWLVLLLLIPSLAIATQKKKAPKVPAKAVQAPPQPAPAAVVPSPPPTPEHEPSSPPEVTYQGGQLTIIARNSTMGDVLNAVRQKTGAAVEMPVSSSERVVGQFGPGAPRDVMAQLLNGSHYDYVLVGSPSDPGALKKVVLMARASGPEAPPAVQNIPPAQNLQGVPQVDTEQSTEENTNELQPDMQQQTTEEESQPEQPQPGQSSPTIKTPEQLLRELQQQQQMQQQQQQQTGQQPGPPPRE